MFYLDNNIKEQYNYILDKIEVEHSYLNKKLQTILECLNSLSIILQSDNTIEIDNSKIIIEILENSKKISDEIRLNKTSLLNLKEKLTIDFSSIIESIEITEEDKLKINAYNVQALELKNKLNDGNLKYEEFILNYIKIVPLLNNSISKTNFESTNSEYVNEDSSDSESISNENDNINEIKDNPILIISEKEKKVFLPYLIQDLNTKLEKNKKYTSLQDIIKKEYIIPLSKYKSPIIARFKESFNLMRKKEKKSIIESLDLAFELAFNSSLHPAIITACKSLDELDLYLDCIEKNELDKFTAFEIKFEILPTK